MLSLYNDVRNPPKEALKPIAGGRLKGMTDINPMWRIKALTEQFGVCGIGWRYEIDKQWLEVGGNDEVVAFTNINLYIKVDGEWSQAIPGTGGSSFVAKERSGLYTNDECYKMSLTDAIGVACKTLGFGADIYWGSDKSKYDTQQDKTKTISKAQALTLFNTANKDAEIFREVLTTFGYKNSTDVEVDKLNQIVKVIKDTLKLKEDNNG